MEAIQEFGAIVRLQEIVRMGEPELEQFAKGCLDNMRQTSLIAFTKKANQRVGALQIQASSRRMVARKRVQQIRIEKEEERIRLEEEAAALAAALADPSSPTSRLRLQMRVCALGRTEAFTQHHALGMKYVSIRTRFAVCEAPGPHC